MKTSFLRLALPLAAMAFCAPISALAQKSSGSTTGPTVIPAGSVSATYVISKSGSYVLGGDRLMNDGAKHIIDITAPDVTVNLNGFSLSFPAGNSTAGFGVNVAAVENVEVREGTISNAVVGISVGFGKGLRVLDVRVTGGSLGVFSNAEDTLVDRCSIADPSNTGIHLTNIGSSVNDCVISGAGQMGIYAGQNVRISRVTITGGSTGVWLGDYGSIRDSRISRVQGTALHAAYYCMIQDNQIVNNYGRAVLLQACADFSGNFVGSTAEFNAQRVGVQCNGTSNVLTNNRLIVNGTHTSGVYVDGGGNTLVQ